MSYVLLVPFRYSPSTFTHKCYKTKRSNHLLALLTTTKLRHSLYYLQVKELERKGKKREGKEKKLYCLNNIAWHIILNTLASALKYFRSLFLILFPRMLLLCWWIFGFSKSFKFENEMRWDETHAIRCDSKAVTITVLIFSILLFFGSSVPRFLDSIHSSIRTHFPWCCNHVYLYLSTSTDQHHPHLSFWFTWFS